MAEGGLLKLRAEDAGDLAVIAGALQDAIVPVADMAWLPDEGRFVLVANRFRWEAGTPGRGEPHERVNAGLSFEGVRAVQRRGIDFAERGRFLNLLTIALEEGGGDDAVRVVLTFSDDAAIRLESAGLVCHLEDFGEPWPTQWQPRHADD